MRAKMGTDGIEWHKNVKYNKNLHKLLIITRAGIALRLQPYDSFIT